MIRIRLSNETDVLMTNDQIAGLIESSRSTTRTVKAPAVSEHTKLCKDHQALVKRVKALEDKLAAEDA